MDNQKEQELASAPIGTLFARLAVPAVTAQIINVLYNLVDRMYIGHIPAIGAAALTGAVILMISAFAALVSMGGAPRASRAMGKGQHDIAEQILGSCAFTLPVISLFLTALMLFWGRDILLLFGASPDTSVYALKYLNVYCLGTIFVQLSLGLNAFITAQGYAVTSMLTVFIGAALNIILDPVFIYLLHMDVKGAALATILSQGISSCWVVGFLRSSRSIVKLRKQNFCFRARLLLPCIALGTSPCLMQITENLAAISFNVTLLKYAGDLAVGAVTILSGIMNFTMLLLTGLTQGAQPILSYNLGAGNGERVRKAFRLLLASWVAGPVCIWCICIFAPDSVAAVFADDSTLISYTAWALQIYMSMSMIFGIQVACQYSFVALGNAPAAIFLSIYRKILLLIPLIFLLPNFFADKALGIFPAEPIADTLAVCTTSVMFFVNFRKLLNSMDFCKKGTT